MAYEIVLIPGDGIGREVVPEWVRTMRGLAKKFGFQVSFSEFPYSYILHRKRRHDAAR